MEVLPPVASSLPPTTTAQEDVVTAGQRRINMVWEVTQATIALMVVLACVVVGVHQALSDSARDFPDILSNAFFLIVGFYFSRTNHAAIGGIGSKPTTVYMGR